ncbi:hypothetical protein [Nocardia tengchongensis]|uniref:hypothetical protein n=1 Tax=Nocardia tengchongensis TaxID=2055889 RepID=UPI003605B99F
MRHRVTAPLVITHNQEGAAEHRYQGQVIPWMPDAQRRHLLSLGMVEEIPDATPPGVVGPDDAVEDDEQEDEQPASGSSAPAVQSTPGARPLQTANKEIWVDYAVTVLGLDRAAAEAMTKNDLITRAG